MVSGKITVLLPSSVARKAGGGKCMNIEANVRCISSTSLKSFFSTVGESVYT